jgi:L-2,4-diaminobutyrate decarboxylase
MSLPVDSREKDDRDARQRIFEAYSPDTLARLAENLTALIAEHFQQVTGRIGPVLNWANPESNVTAAGQWVDATEADAHRTGRNLEGRFRQLVDACLSHGNNLHHPRYIGHQVPASVPIAALFDFVGSVTNQVMAIYEMGPWATAVERAMIDRVGEVLGLDMAKSTGLITHGGSLGNLTALLTARNVVLGDVWERGLTGRDKAPVIVVHTDAHYGVARSAGVLGVGTNQIIRASLDDRRRMDPQRLDELLARLRREGTPIIAVSGCACATPIGAFDELTEIADVCRRHDVWLHVDAAHGGAAAFSDRHRHLVAGLEQADSFICDAHKMMFVPALCAFVFYRNRDHRFEAFRQEAPYLFDPSAPGMAEYDSGLMTIECTKRAAAYGLWGVWSLFGRQLFADMVNVTFDLGRRFYEILREADDFEPLHTPECNIVVFRYVPAKWKGSSPAEIGEFNRRLRRRLIESGQFYIVQTTIDGIGALRVTIINPLTTESDLRELMETLRRLGKEQGQISEN